MCFRLYPLSHPFIFSFLLRIQAMITKRICQTCGRRSEELKRKCDQCGGVVGKAARRPVKCTLPVDLHNINVGMENKESHPEIRMVESILLNPNSYKNVEDILKQLRKTANIGKERICLYWLRWPNILFSGTNH